MLLERGQRGHGLEGRARRIGPLDRAVESGDVRLRGRRLVDQRTERAERLPPHVDARVVGRVRRHREDRAVARVKRDDRAAVRRPGALVAGGLDPVDERLLSRLLEPDVERQPELVARRRVVRDLERAAGPAQGVDPEVRHTGLPAEVRVIGALEARLADVRARPQASSGRRVELLLRDLPDRTEHLRAQRAVRVMAQVGARDLDARELVAVLGEVEHDVVPRRLVDRHGGERIAAVLAEVGRDLPEGHLHEPRELLELRVPTLLREVRRPDADRGAGHVRDQRDAVPVDDRPARRLHRHRAQLVVLRRPEVLASREHLERPEPQEEDAEDDERDDAEDADPDRDLRREPVVGSCMLTRNDPGPGRGSTVCRRASQGAGPPSRARPTRWGGRGDGRARRAAASAGG